MKPRIAVHSRGRALAQLSATLALGIAVGSLTVITTQRLGRDASPQSQQACKGGGGVAGAAGAGRTATAAAPTLVPGASGAASQYSAEMLDRLAQYQTLIPPRYLRRGVHSLGDPARTRRFVHKLLSGQPVSVSAVGGSNTAGAGGLEPGTGGPPFMPRLFDWVRQVSPGAAHTLKHAGIGASTSSLYSVCANDMVQPDADLVLVEFTRNDVQEMGMLRHPQRLAFERLLRKLLDLPGRPAVALLHHYAYPAAEASFWVLTAENDFDVLGAYYGLPSLSIRAAAYHLMQQNVTGFKAHQGWTQVPEEGQQRATEELFYFDSHHPLGSTGHRALFDLVVGLVRETALDLALRPLGREDEEAAQEPLPPPMTPGNFQRKTSTCLLQRAFEKVVVRQEGFAWRNERPQADAAGSRQHEKWGWIGERPGAWAELEVDTSSELQGELRRDANEVLLAHLRSYQHNGRARVECVAGCTCDSTELDGYWPAKVSLTELHRFMASQHPRCRLRVTVLDSTSSPDGGHKVKLLGVMVAEGASSVVGEAATLDADGQQLDLVANRGDAGEGQWWPTYEAGNYIYTGLPTKFHLEEFYKEEAARRGVTVEQVQREMEQQGRAGPGAAEGKPEAPADKQEAPAGEQEAPEERRRREAAEREAAEAEARRWEVPGEAVNSDGRPPA